MFRIGILMWCLKKQPIVILNSIEAECQTIFKDAKKATWSIMFMNKLCFKQLCHYTSTTKFA
jgi:hypothetical protein